MKKTGFLVMFAVILLLGSCTSQKKLTYLGNVLPGGNGEYFEMDIPDYKIQTRDVLYITVKAMTPDGLITDFLTASRGGAGVNLMQSESGQFLSGFDVSTGGAITLPSVGVVNVAGLTLDETRKLIQEKASAVFPGSTVECKLLSFRYTVLGEVKIPGTYINYNSYLTIFEAIGKAGGIGDFGKRNKVLVLRPEGKGTRVYEVNLQDKQILKSQAYFLMPNDVVIVEPERSKILNMNLPLISFIMTGITSSVTMLILILNYNR
jgi:polysaccharide export outer membrane protein